MCLHNSQSISGVTHAFHSWKTAPETDPRRCNCVNLYTMLFQGGSATERHMVSTKDPGVRSSVLMVIKSEAWVTSEHGRISSNIKSMKGDKVCRL